MRYGAGKAERLEEILTRVPVIPVLTIRDPASAVPVAAALRDGGLPVIEITLRTQIAYDAMRLIKSEVPGVTVGAGTVLIPEQISGAMACGAAFLVSPGATPALLQAADEAPVPLLPSAATPSEIMALLEKGFVRQRFFPAEAGGGPAYLRALAAPLPDVSFVPIGGVSFENAADYLALPNVVCLSGNFVAPPEMIDAGDYEGIAGLAAKAAALQPSQAA